MDDKDIKEIGGLLDTLRKNRNDADYEGKIKFSKKEAELRCDEVQQIFDILDDNLAV